MKAFNFPLKFSPDGDVTQSINPSTPKNYTEGKYWWGNGISKNSHHGEEFWDCTREGCGAALHFTIPIQTT